jgi:hypothetical protein
LERVKLAKQESGKLAKQKSGIELVELTPRGVSVTRALFFQVIRDGKEEVIIYLKKIKKPLKGYREVGK